MKRTLVVLLALMMLCVSALAMAEAAAEVTVEVTFEGEWVEFEEYGLKICLPTDWVEYEVEEELYMAGTEDDTQLLVMNELELDEATIEALLAGLTDTEGLTDVAIVIINGVSYVTYVIEDDDVFGVVTITEAGAVLDFMFAPNSDSDFVDLAMQIVASITTME